MYLVTVIYKCIIIITSKRIRAIYSSLIVSKSPTFFKNVSVLQIGFRKLFNDTLKKIINFMPYPSMNHLVFTNKKWL